jgi:hypothetical protein
MAPWPIKPCPHCENIITDLLSEMVPDSDQMSADFKALVDRKPGGAITCPYCQGAVEYADNGDDLVVSQRVPLRYSRGKVEARAAEFAKLFPGTDASPQAWISSDKGMAGALAKYRYAEDENP